MTNTIVSLAMASCLASWGCSKASGATNATPEQLSLLKAYQTSEFGVSNELVAAILKEPGNEGAAIEVVKLLEANMPKRTEVAPTWWINLASFLDRRACGPLEPGEEPKIVTDGPYLAPFVRIMLRRFEQELDTPPHFLRSTLMWAGRSPRAYLVLHVEDEAFRKDVRRLANQYANCSEGHTAGQTEFAWSMLLLLGDLHDGMDADEAKKVLGPPTRYTDTALSWYVPSPSPQHISHGLVAVTEGKTVKNFRLN